MNAKLILGETFSPRIIVGTLLVMIGAVFVAIFGVAEEGEQGLEELLVLWKRPPFLAFFLVVITTTLIALGGVSVFHPHSLCAHVHRGTPGGSAD